MSERERMAVEPDPRAEKYWQVNEEQQARSKKLIDRSEQFQTRLEQLAERQERLADRFERVMEKWERDAGPHK